MASSLHISRENPAPATDAAPNLALPWVVRLRYGMVFGGMAVLSIAAYLFRPSHLIPWTLTPFVLILVSNLWLHRGFHLSAHSPQTVLGTVFLFDTLCLTAALGLTGGPMNPFSLLYLVQITLSVVVLKKIWTWVLGILSSVCFGLLFFFHLPFAPFYPFHAERGFAPHLIGMWIAFVAAAILISFFTSRVSDALRFREEEVLALQERIAKQERLASLVTLAAGAAHELGTPLGTIAVVARELQHYASTLTDGDELREDAKLIRSEVERCQLILQRMSAGGAEPMGETSRPIEMSELLQEVVGHLPDGQRPTVSISTPESKTMVPLPVRATVQSLVALLQNALDAGAIGAEVVLKARCVGEQLVFSVCDGGAGMTEAVLRGIGEPFFTTKEAGRGMGLGTFLVRTFAERLGGALSYESTPGKGTTATLRLPVQSPCGGAK